ncbi:hypothetical protein V5887_000357 [Klebsiella aerogenes]
MKNCSVIFTYNRESKEAVSRWIKQAREFEFITEIIAVSEGDEAGGIDLGGVIDILVTDYRPYREPLVMAIGAHYASGDAVVLCRDGGCLAGLRKHLQAFRSSKYLDLGSGSFIFSSDEFPWSYEIDTGFKRGTTGKFLDLSWEVRGVQ